MKNEFYSNDLQDSMVTPSSHLSSQLERILLRIKVLQGKVAICDEEIHRQRQIKYKTEARIDALRHEYSALDRERFLLNTTPSEGEALSLLEAKFGPELAKKVLAQMKGLGR